MLFRSDYLDRIEQFHFVPFLFIFSQGTKKAHPDHIVTEVRQYTQSPMQTEYATSGASDKHRMISVFEIGVFCDRTVLADTLLFAKNYVKL